MARKGPSQDWNPGLQCPGLWPLRYSTHRLLCCPLNTKKLSTTQQASKMRIYHLTSDQVSPPPHHCRPDSPLSLPPKSVSSVSSTCLASPTSVWPAERPHSCFMLSLYYYCGAFLIVFNCFQWTSHFLCPVKFWVEMTIFLQCFCHP